MDNFGFFFRIDVQSDDGKEEEEKEQEPMKKRR